MPVMPRMQSESPPTWDWNKNFITLAANKDLKVISAVK